MLRLLTICGLLLALLGTAGLTWAEGPSASEGQELSILRRGLTESVALEGTNYRDFTVAGTSASFVLDSPLSASGSQEFEDGAISRISWDVLPAETAGVAALAADTDSRPVKVSFEFRKRPTNSLINAAPGTEALPDVPQVIAGFSFSPGRPGSQRPLAGGRGRQDNQSSSAYGNYELPRLPYPHYSDALVTLKVRNTDFREVLWLLSEIGQVSIMLDPYWDDEPTGSRRPVGGGANGDTPGGDAGPGFRPGSEFGGPQAPREGTGNLSLDFKNVPFDMALDLVLQSVGLVKVDVYPGQQ